jgi:ubiquinol-cytochrome c reductase cytochrome c subunit
MKRAAVVLLVAIVSAVALGGTAAQEEDAPELGSEARGESLFVAACATCHGTAGQGTIYAPSILDAGAAGADFMLRTGRMPLGQPPDSQPLDKPPAFDEQGIRDIVAYVATLGEGPGIPEVRTDGDLSLGMELFVANCAPCHGATAAGGAVGDGALAPTLERATPRIVAEAMILGPGQMPAFALPEDETSAIVTYVEYLRADRTPGGFSIGNIGPVAEGFVAWLVGMGLLALAAFVVGRNWETER